MGSRFRGGDGDWICTDPECANLNFARRNACNRCGKEKESHSRKKQIGVEIGKAAAEKSRGLFSADDWQCTKCGNVNWARRQQCNMCNAPKFGEIEERTGYGGGYNDRGIVEYIEREESDDEYDEFGRKKKKFRKPSSSESSEQVSKKCEENKPKIETAVVEEFTESEKGKVKEYEDEDEEDDDDDGDLSKYDLSDWGDGADGNEQEDLNKTEQSNDSGGMPKSKYYIENNESVHHDISNLTSRSSCPASHDRDERQNHCRRDVSNSSYKRPRFVERDRSRSRSPLTNNY